MSNIFHKDSVSNHVLHHYTYADASARTGATGFVSADIGKVAKQTSDTTFWILTATTPTWVQLGGGSSSGYSFIGDCKFANFSGTLTRTNTALGAFTSTSTVPGPTVLNNPGVGTIQSTDVDNLTVTVNGLAAGTYRTRFIFFCEGSSNGAVLLFAINDGTTTSTNLGIWAPTSGRGGQIVVEGTFVYGSSGNKTFTVYGSANSGSVSIDSSGIMESYFMIEKIV